MSLSGADSATFTITMDDITTLHAGESLPIRVAFNPIHSGEHSASLTINRGAARPLVIPLSGTGIVRPESLLSYSTDALDFGSMSEDESSLALTLSHVGDPGSPDISISGFYIGGMNPDDFDTSLDGSVTLSAGEAVTIMVSFVPASTGAKTADLSITSNANRVIPTYMINLSGTRRVARVSAGLQTLFDFNGYSGGSLIRSSAGTPITLDISEPARISSVNGGISVNHPVRIAQDSPANLLSSLESSGEVTIEFWIRPTSTSHNAEIMSLASLNAGVDLGIAQDGTTYAGQLRMANDEANPATIATGGGYAQTIIQHLVFTYSATDGLGRIYINGNLVTTQENVGISLNDWSGDTLLTLANAADGNLDSAAWRGELYTFAIYDRALTQAEVNQNYMAGEA